MDKNNSPVLLSRAKVHMPFCRNIFLYISVAMLSYIIIPSTHSNAEEQVAPNATDPKHKSYEDFFSYFVKNAPHVAGDYEQNYSADSISWLNEEALSHGTKLYNRSYTGVSLAGIFSGIELVCYKPVLSVLMGRKVNLNRVDSYTRIIRSATYQQLWARGGMALFDPSTSAYRTLHNVRRSHRAAALASTNRSESFVQNIASSIERVGEDIADLENLTGAIRKDLAHVDTKEAPRHLFRWDSGVPISQMDLGVVQFIIVSHIVMNPEAFGIYNYSPQEIQATIHVMALIGRLLGIQDRFNVALNLPLHNYGRFYRNVVIGSWKEVDLEALRIMRVITESLADNNPVPSMFSLKCWLYNFLKKSLPEFKGENIRATMSRQDKFCLSLMYVSTGIFHNSQLSNAAVDTWLRMEKDRLKIVT